MFVQELACETLEGPNTYGVKPTSNGEARPYFDSHKVAFVIGLVEKEGSFQHSFN